MNKNLPGGSNKNETTEPFGNLMNSIDSFFQEKPIKGILQSIDECFKAPFPFHSFSVDLIEKEKEFIISAELPGVKKEQIQIDLFSNYVTISVHSKNEFIEENEKSNFYSKQQSSQKASRTLSLPFPINEKQVKANYQDGLLQISIPKQQGKRIEIDRD